MTPCKIYKMGMQTKHLLIIDHKDICFKKFFGMHGGMRKLTSDGGPLLSLSLSPPPTILKYNFT